MTAKRLLFIVNDPAFFLSHRLAVAEGARDAGYSVSVATMAGRQTERIRELGYPHFQLPLTRSGNNVFGELKAFAAILRLLWALRPDFVHLVTIKPVIYGGIAVRCSPVKAYVAAISGLGFTFMASGPWAKLRKHFVLLLYKIALGRKNGKVILQNPDDRDLLVMHGIVARENSVIIRGSGVDLSTYSYVPEPNGIPVVTMASRLLRDKGVMEFVAAAELVHKQGVAARFLLIGDPDIGNPATLKDADLESLRHGGVVELFGHRDDIPRLFSRSNLIVLPSYREGLPKVLVEAAACGRAVITTDVPGCRYSIEPNVTGLLVPARDSEALASAIKRLIQDSHLRQKMGVAGRLLAGRDFGVEKIVQQHLDVYKELDPLL